MDQFLESIDAMELEGDSASSRWGSVHKYLKEIKRILDDNNKNFAVLAQAIADIRETNNKLVRAIGVLGDLTNEQKQLEISKHLNDDADDIVVDRVPASTLTAVTGTFFPSVLSSRASSTIDSKNSAFDRSDDRQKRNHVSEPLCSEQNSAESNRADRSSLDNKDSLGGGVSADFLQDELLIRDGKEVFTQALESSRVCTSSTPSIFDFPTDEVKQDSLFGDDGVFLNAESSSGEKEGEQDE